METTEKQSTQKVQAAFIKAQAEIKGAPKDKDNPYFGSKYADLANIVEVVRVPFAKHGLAFIQDVTSTAESVSCVTTILHESGERLVSGTLTLPVAQKTPQAFGSASTYVRRYQLQSIAGVAAEQDDDGNAASATPPSSRANGHSATPKPEAQAAPRRMEVKDADPRPEPPPVTADLYGNVETPESINDGGRPASVTFRFGKRKGATSHDVTDKDLLWYLDRAREAVEDESKARFLESNRRELNMLQAEADWRNSKS